MLPFLKTLDECGSVPVNPCELESGDVVVYESGDGKLFVHRVLSVDKDKKLAVIKGDNVPFEILKEMVEMEDDETVDNAERQLEILSA